MENYKQEYSKKTLDEKIDLVARNSALLMKYDVLKNDHLPPGAIAENAAAAKFIREELAMQNRVVLTEISLLPIEERDASASKLNKALGCKDYEEYRNKKENVIEATLEEAQVIQFASRFMQRNYTPANNHSIEKDFNQKSKIDIEREIN